jgi:hypothetical protein
VILILPAAAHLPSASPALAKYPATQVSGSNPDPGAETS